MLGQLFNRYPSEGDWEAAEQLVSLGAPADELSLYIIDSFGELREFKYSDRAIYEDLTQGQKQSGFNLPPSVSEEGVTTEHCAPQAS